MPSPSHVYLMAVRHRVATILLAGLLACFGFVGNFHTVVTTSTAQIRDSHHPLQGQVQLQVQAKGLDQTDTDTRTDSRLEWEPRTNRSNTAMDTRGTTSATSTRKARQAAHQGRDANWPAREQDKENMEAQISNRPPTQNQTASNPLFLQYASHWGWGNQWRCAVHAYFIAKATGRTLVTAPVLPHWNTMAYGLWPRVSFNKAKDMRKHCIHFQLDYPLEKDYLTQPNVPLENVLDISYTFPNVSIIHYQSFHDQYYHKGHTNLSHWVMEANYTHANTMFMLDQPNLENTFHKEGITRRDISTIAQQAKHYQLWSYLDPFLGFLHPSLGEQGKIPMRFAAPIRQTAKSIHEQVWNNIPYSSIHLRVGDGIFKEREQDQIHQVLQQHGEQVHGWIQQRLADHQTIPSNLGVFVATDLASTKQSSLTTALSNQLFRDHLPSKNYSFVIQVYYSESFENYSKALEPTLVFPGMFLDQQLAACAPIAFTGSHKSRFSGIIEQIRRSPNSCDVSQ